ncbi:HEAT repeat domain-containing protein [Candidatus Latescibacterota bacterium]
MKKIIGYILILIVCIGCSDSTENLIKDLESDNSTTRRRAGLELVQGRGGPETVPKLIQLLNSDNERTVFLAAQILGSQADTTAVQPLGLLIENPNPNIRSSAAWSLGSIGHESALSYLEKALDDSVADVRNSAIKGIGYIHDPRAVKSIYKMFRDEADSVRAAAVHSLWMYRSYPEVEITAADFAVPLSDPSETVRYVTVQALGYEIDEDNSVAGELLIEALRDQNKYVRVEAIVSLGKLKYEPAVPYFKDMYDFSTLEEEYAISVAIKQISNEDFPPPEQY